MTSYIVAAAIMTPLTGWLAGRLGIKYVFLFSVAGFTLASALCGVATSLTQMVIFRLLRGSAEQRLCRCLSRCCCRSIRRSATREAMSVWGMGVILAACRTLAEVSAYVVALSGWYTRAVEG